MTCPIVEIYKFKNNKTIFLFREIVWKSVKHYALVWRSWSMANLSVWEAVNILKTGSSCVIKLFNN